MALFADDNLSLTVGFLAHLHPFFMAVEKFFTALVNPLHRLGFLEIILFAEDKHDDVGILFDRTRSAQIGQHRAFVLALFDRPAELGERHHRNIELLGHGLQHWVITEISCTRLSARAPAPGRINCR